MNNNESNPTLDFVVKQAKQQIKANLHLIPQDKEIDITSSTTPNEHLLIQDTVIHAMLISINNSGDIKYLLHGRGGIRNQWVNYTQAHWLILVVVNYWLHEKIKNNKLSNNTKTT